MKKKRIRIACTCSDFMHHEHRWRWTAWLCGRGQLLFGAFRECVRRMRFVSVMYKLPPSNTHIWATSKRIYKLSDNIANLSHDEKVHLYKLICDFKKMVKKYNKTTI